MQRVFTGVRQFLNQDHSSRPEFYQKLASKQQNPLALFITCSDSRVNPNLITSTEPGDLFLIRNAGNIVPPFGSVFGGEAATIEYAIEVLKIRHVVICGHSQCGAINALVTGQGLDSLPSVKAWCAHAEATRRIVERKFPNMSGAEYLVAATEQNVLTQMRNLSTHPSVAAHLDLGDLTVYGWYYDIASGQVRQFDATQEKFVDIATLNVEGSPPAPAVATPLR